ncbi:MAG TPA: TIGR04255 family protein [Methylomirabilota bacterium]|nr:TIGR04255 family protein [Methylomirabilota bacterium]
MSDAFPFQIPERLPIRIEPCPIVEAIFEARFVGLEPWATMPGLLFAQIREKYPEQKTLPVAQVPEELRRQDPALIHLPLIQFLSGRFLIQLGPRVVSLVTKPNTYPGWKVIEQELGWLLERLRTAGFIGETERLSARYIDFFDGDVFKALRLGLQVNGQPLKGLQTDLTTVLRRGALTIRLNVTNGAIVATKDGPKPGSVLDMDAWYGPMEADLFGNGLARFGEAHQVIKDLFFGLLTPENLASLNPVYE